MSEDEEIHDFPAEPYIGTCEFCDQGKLRIWFAKKEAVALCDECELFWENISEVVDNPQTEPQGTYPEGPCGAEDVDDWAAASREEIEELGFSKYIIGESA